MTEPIMMNQVLEHSEKAHLYGPMKNISTVQEPQKSILRFVTFLLNFIEMYHWTALRQKPEY